MNVLKQAQKLTHHSLESYINELTQDPSVFEYSPILQHPQIKTISPQYVELVELFSYGDLETHKKNYKGTKLNDKQLEQLKRLSILSQFEGLQEMRISTLSERIGEKKNVLFKFLVEMNTKGLISIKIDEKKGMCQILWAKHREVQNRRETQSISEAKLDLMYKKNEKLINQLKDVEQKKKPKRTTVWDV